MRSNEIGLMRKRFWHDRIQIAKYREQYYLWLSMILVGSWYLYLNFTIPLSSDDYWYAMSWSPSPVDPSRRLESLMDVIPSMRAYYQGWGGRIVAAAIGQLALMGEWQTAVFRVLNSCVFLGLNLLVVDFARRKLGTTFRDRSVGIVGNSGNERSTWMLFLISFYLFWIFVRTLGETTLWLVGSVHYLWTLFFLLLFLRLSITLYTRNSFPILILHVLMGFLAGCGYESTSLTGLIMSLILLFRRKRTFREISWQLPGFLAYLGGYILLVASPGNIIRRAEDVAVDRSFFSTLLNNIPQYIELHRYSWEILLLLLVLVLVAFKRVGRIDWTTWLFIGAGFFNNGLMLASPLMPVRASFASSVFFICAIISLLSNPRLISKRTLDWILIAASALSIILAVSVGISYREAKVLAMERKSIVREALEKGETTVEWPLLRTRIDQRVFGRDISVNPSNWINKKVADYYGLDAVSGREPGFEYYDETKPWLTANSDFGDLKLIDVSKYSDKKVCFLFFRFRVNRNVDIDWDKLVIRLAYTYDGSLHKEIIGLLPDKYFWHLGAKAQIMTQPHWIGENHVLLMCLIPKEHSDINRIELRAVTMPGVYRWKKQRPFLTQEEKSMSAD